MSATATRLGDLPGVAASRWPDATAVTYGEKNLTFAELSAEVDRAARALLARGVQKGDTVGLWVTNRPMRAVWFVSAEKGYVAGDDGLLWRTDDGGRNWVRVAGAPSDLDFTAVFAFSDRGWAVGRDGRVFYFEE